MLNRVVAVLLLLAGPAMAAGPSIEEMRGDLRDIYQLHDYRPGKNSFVLGLETFSGCPRLLKPGDRQVLLDVQGAGSLRHIWETHGSGPSPYTLQFFVDGEKDPSLWGGIEDFVRAAQETKQSLVTVAGSFVPNNSNNLYLPVPFEKSLKIELVPKRDMPLVFMQLDYRIEDDSLHGIRLKQTGEGSGMKLEYEAKKASRLKSPPLTEPVSLSAKRYEATGSYTSRIDGPGIIRRLSLQKPAPGMRLRIRFDGATQPAVDVDAADFFGPFRGVALNNNQCFLPMPFKENAEIEVEDPSGKQHWVMEVDYEKTKPRGKNWGYFHAWSSVTDGTTGYLPHPVLYAQGRGHWLGMSLYETGHDHGGGDFVLIDGESERPALLHGINGEDYFSFAYFGRGQNLPYTEAFDNATGRIRLHLENPYVFDNSIEVAWSVLRDLHPRSVAYWYQDSPDGIDRESPSPPGREWQVFGPATVPVKEDGNTIDSGDREKLFAALPDPSVLDAGEVVAVTRSWNGAVQRGVFKGWAEQTSVGPHLNLAYIFRHVMSLGHNSHLGYEPRCMMAQTLIHSNETKKVDIQVSYDDPLWISLNDQTAYFDMQHHQGLVTAFFEADLRSGKNTLQVRLSDSPNSDCGWAGLSLRILDKEGRPLSDSGH